MLWVIGLALLLSLADALFLLVVAAHIGALPTVGLVILTALLGVLLVRSEGRTTLARIQQRLVQGEAPTDELLDGAMIVLGAGFLITPGLLTDLTGFILVIPVTRYPLRLAVKRWIVGPYVRRKIEEGAVTVDVGGSVDPEWTSGGGWPGYQPGGNGARSGDRNTARHGAYRVDVEDVEDVDTVEDIEDVEDVENGDDRENG